MKLSERIAALEARIKILEDRLIQPEYEQPDFIPDDKYAPDGAVCVAMDADGWWWWYKDMPQVGVLSFLGLWMQHRAGVCTNTARIDPEYWKRSLMEVKR